MSTNHPAPNWDERYSSEAYVYGRLPNAFLAEAVAGITPGKALCLAEGEGRNAVHLARLGWQVTAVDGSAVGMGKARRLAREAGIEVITIVADLAHYRFDGGPWDLIISTFGHVPPDIRARVHGSVAGALRPGGHYILEAYHPRNIGRGTGGPQVAELCITPGDLAEELVGMRFDLLHHIEREVNEGELHRGLATVTQCVASKI